MYMTRVATDCREMHKSSVLQLLVINRLCVNMAIITKDHASMSTHAKTKDLASLLQRLLFYPQRVQYSTHGGYAYHDFQTYGIT